MREPPTSLLKVKSRVRVVALLVGIGGALGDGCRRAVDRVRDHDRQHDHDHHRRRRRRGRRADRHPHRRLPTPRRPRPGAAASKKPRRCRRLRPRQPTTTVRAGATRHRRAVRLGRRTSSGVLQEPDAGVDRRRQQRHGAHVPRVGPLRSTEPRHLSRLFPFDVHMQHRPPEHLHEVHGSVRARARRATTSASTRSPSATACRCSPTLSSARRCRAAAFDRRPPTPSTCGRSPASAPPSSSPTDHGPKSHGSRRRRALTTPFERAPLTLTTHD